MNQRIRITAISALFGAATMAGAASAQEGPLMMGPGGGIDFVVIDTDSNGSLSRAELMSRATERLARTDTNGDGALDREELIAAMPGPHGGIEDVFAADPAERFADRLLALVGGTETGRVEIVVLADRRVNALLAFADSDRDAAISQEEADAITARRQAWMERHGDHGRSRMDRHGHEAPGPGPQGDAPPRG